MLCTRFQKISIISCWRMSIPMRDMLSDTRELSDCSAHEKTAFRRRNERRQPGCGRGFLQLVRLAQRKKRKITVHQLEVGNREVVYAFARKVKEEHG
jgi:hypothetical protein